ncbi:MAG: hypothetical protein ACREXR_00370 [Gammaproteobacteria bacterium]
MNTDAVAAGDLINLAATDTGTTPADVTFVALNVEFTTGHGCFHGSARPVGQTLSLASVTRFFPLAGELLSTGNATEANEQWRNRGYTTVEALAVRITANARTTNTEFRLRVNGVNAAGPVDIAGLATGLFTLTGIGLAITSGDLLSFSLVTGTGTQAITFSLMAVTLKSTANKSETFNASPLNGLARAASATENYYQPGGDFFQLSGSTEANNSVKVGFAARITNLRAYVSANTYTGNSTLSLFVNGVSALTKTIAAAATGWQENTVDTVDIVATDEISLAIVGGTSGSATFRTAGVTFEPSEIGVVPSEYSYESRSASLTVGSTVNPATSEYAFEIASTRLSPVLFPATSEYGFEIVSAGLSPVLFPATSEYAFEIVSAGLTVAHIINPATSEYAFEIASAGLTVAGAAVNPAAFEYSYESRSASLTVLNTLAPARSEYAFEIFSAFLESFVPSTQNRVITVSSIPRVVEQEIERRVMEVTSENRLRIMDEPSRVISIPKARQVTQVVEGNRTIH